jgi:AcrR family transcriptional regulator
VPEVAAAAGVATGSVYVYFEDKQNLVNEVYRDAKQRLKTALLEGLDEPDAYDAASGERWFNEVWRRLSAFALAEPDAFRFLEMQDHVEYLDAKSRTLELSVLGPLFLAGHKLRGRSGGPPVDIAIALLWGAFVGVVKAGRLGYLRIDDSKLAEAGTAAWRLIAPITTSHASDSSRTSRTTDSSGTSQRRKKGN